jgi:hypothetical protein
LGRRNNSNNESNHEVKGGKCSEKLTFLVTLSLFHHSGKKNTKFEKVAKQFRVARSSTEG